MIAALLRCLLAGLIAGLGIGFYQSHASSAADGDLNPSRDVRSL
jgi:F0F1-type ATP synthase membrane subunit c/vacuolar-type H+-ATPase subunit K